nr:hypothetical protein CFP56_02898 [Quercus suber]POF13879.1 hypothetical protein CFP56_02903 [Quercus suber]
MSDPLSISAAVVGIAVPALHATRLLLEDVNSLIDALKAMQRLREDLVAVEAAYQSLQSIKDSDWSTLGGDMTVLTKSTISACEHSCTSLHSDLKRWTKNSHGETLSKRDRVNIGFFKERQLRATSDQLQATKLTLSSAVSMVTLYVVTDSWYRVLHAEKEVGMPHFEIEKLLTKGGNPL